MAKAQRDFFTEPSLKTHILTLCFREHLIRVLNVELTLLLSILPFWIDTP